MHVRSRKVVFGHHPFAAGERGASLYVGVGPEDGSDPGPDSVKFAVQRAIGSKWIRGPEFHFGDGVSKGCIGAQTTYPTAEIEYEFPAEWHGRVIYCQVRTWWNHCELPHNTSPLRIDFTDAGELDPLIYGTGRILGADKRDGGIYRVRTVYTPSTSGTQPTILLLRKTAGAGTLADVELEYDDTVREYEFDTEALTDDEEYTFAFVAQAGSVEATLDTITFTADAAGPPAPTSVTITRV